MKNATVAGRFDAALWEKYGQTPDYLERIARVAELLPPDATDILDAGCGRGEVADSIAAQRAATRVIGADPSMDALQHPRIARSCAALPDLPFGDGCFDVVMCLQVLEHLDDAAFGRACRELLRVSRRYILIGVPFRENLLTKQARCAECGLLSHADGHVRSFDMTDARTLLPDAVLERTVLAGVRQRRQPRLAARLARLSGHYVPDNFMCPRCGGRRAAGATTVRRALGAATAPLRQALLLTQRPIPYWLLALYRKSDV